MAGHGRMRESRGPARTHMSAIWLPGVCSVRGERAAFQSQAKKESLIRLAVALRGQIAFS